MRVKGRGGVMAVVGVAIAFTLYLSVGSPASIEHVARADAASLPLRRDIMKHFGKSKSAARGVTKFRKHDVLDFCYAMLAGKQYIRTRVQPALDTWLRKAYVILFIERGDVGTALAHRISSPTVRVDMLDYPPNDIVHRSPGGAWKNMPVAKVLLDSAPFSKWYVIVDDDTYVFQHNLRLELKDHMHDYMTSRKLFGSLFPACRATMNFVHGGGGMFFNRAALEAIGPFIDECQVKYTYRKDVSKTNCYFHTGGDARLSLCMVDDAHTKLHDVGNRAWRWGMMKALERLKHPDDYLISVHEVRLPDLFVDLNKVEETLEASHGNGTRMYLKDFRAQFDDDKKYSSILRKPWSYVEMEGISRETIAKRYVRLERVRFHGNHLEDNRGVEKCEWICYQKMYFCNVIQINKHGQCQLKNQPPLPMEIISPQQVREQYHNTTTVPHVYAVIPPFDDHAANTELGYIMVSTSGDGFKRFRAMLRKFVGDQAMYAVFDKTRVRDIPDDLSEFDTMDNVAVDVISDAKNDADLVVRAARNFHKRLGFKDWYGLISDRTFVMPANLRGMMAQYYRIHFRPLMIVTNAEGANSLDGGLFVNDLAMAMYMENAEGCVAEVVKANTSTLEQPNMAFEFCIKNLHKFDKRCGAACQHYDKKFPVYILRTPVVFYAGVDAAFEMRAEESTLFPLSFGAVDLAEMEVLGVALKHSSGAHTGAHQDVKYTTWKDVQQMKREAVRYSLMAST